MTSWWDLVLCFWSQSKNRWDREQSLLERIQICIFKGKLASPSPRKNLREIYNQEIKSPRNQEDGHCDQSWPIRDSNWDPWVLFQYWSSILAGDYGIFLWFLPIRGTISGRFFGSLISCTFFHQICRNQRIQGSFRRN